VVLVNDNSLLIHSIFKGTLHRDPTPDDLKVWEQKLASGMPVAQMMDAFLKSAEFSVISKKVRGLLFPPGHFYSPIVNIDDAREHLNGIINTDSLQAIEISKQGHIDTWNELLPFLQTISFPEDQTEGFRYFFKCPSFSYGDGSILHAMLRRYRPKRLIEVGSGYSSACALDTIDHFLTGSVDVSFIEPYPELLLRLLAAAADKYKIYTNKIQEVDLDVFKQLEDGDFLFIDSTHVMKTGSDVCHELFTLLPMLKPGVFIHFHDIFWPFEYGKNWVLQENRSWNEIYGLRAFLMYNNAFEIVFFNDFFEKTCRNIINRDYPAMLKNSGGSIWLRKLI
jgi:predicted O-methyltransferase YrrM